MNKFKLETVNMDGVEIMDMGEWKGITFDKAMYEKIIENFKAGIIEPYLNIDHAKDVTESFGKMLKAMSMGFVSDLKVVGTKLVAAFKQVPKTIAELIQAGALKKRSVEFWKNYRHADGKIYSGVLEAVTFHGANGAPAVHTLSDFVNLYKTELQSIGHDENAGEVETIHFKEGSTEMTDEEKREIEALRKYKADHPVDDPEKTKMKADAKAKDDKIAEQEKAIKDGEKFKADQAEKDKATLKTEADAFVKTIVDGKKLLPKFAEMKSAEYQRLKVDESEEGKKSFTLFKEEMEGRGEILNFGDFKGDGNENKGGEKVDLKNIDTIDEADANAPFDKIEEAIQTRMKNSGEDYSHAAVSVGAMTPKEAGIEVKGDA